MMKSSLPRYLVVGALNTVLGCAVIGLAGSVLEPVPANLVGYAVVVPVSFLTHRQWAFKDHGEIAKSFGRYLPTVLIGYVANWAALKIGLRAEIPAFLCQIAALTAHVVCTFLLSRLYVFTTTKQTKVSTKQGRQPVG